MAKYSAPVLTTQQCVGYAVDHLRPDMEFDEVIASIMADMKNTFVGMPLNDKTLDEAKARIHAGLDFICNTPAGVLEYEADLFPIGKDVCNMQLVFPPVSKGPPITLLKEDGLHVVKNHHHKVIGRGPTVWEALYAAQEFNKVLKHVPA